MTQRRVMLDDYARAALGARSRKPKSMSERSLQLLIGKAIISEEFRKGLLNGHRAELLGDFDLEPTEVRELMKIRANNLAEFAGAVEQLSHSHNQSQTPNNYSRRMPSFADTLNWAVSTPSIHTS